MPGAIVPGQARPVGRGIPPAAQPPPGAPRGLSGPTRGVGIPAPQQMAPMPPRGPPPPMPPGVGVPVRGPPPGQQY